MTMRLQLPGIGYMQGTRRMVVTALEPIALIKMVRRPDVWNPLGEQAHGNRPQDPKHRARIAEYLEQESDWVLGAVVLYASPRDAEFVADEKDSEYAVQRGELRLNIGAEFDVGDGQHRIGALSDVIYRHNEEGDAIIERLRRAGQPAVVVIDDSPLHRAQDFTDLQRNVKPPTGSLAMSMDRRQAINRFLVRLIQSPELPVFDGGNRVEYLKDSPGKLSSKLFSFKTVRYVTGTALIGPAPRSSAGWEDAANDVVSDDTSAMQAATEMWKGISALPGIADVIADRITPAKLRERSLLTTAGVLYAIAYALHAARESGISFGSATRALAQVKFERPRLGGRPPSEKRPITADESIFAGNLIEPVTGQVGSGRPSWEAAGKALLKVIQDSLSTPAADPTTGAETAAAKR